MLLAVLIGAACAGLLVALRRPLFRLMALAPAVAARARTLLFIRAGALPLFFLSRACLGLLAGYQRIWLLAGLSLFCAALDVAGNYVALNVLRWGLDGTGWATGLAQLVSAVLGLACVVGLPPADAAGRIRWCGAPGGGGTREEGATAAAEEGAARGLLQEAAGGASPLRHPWTAMKEYLRASGNIVLRSLLLQTATYGLVIAAGQLGTAALAAHQVGKWDSPLTPRALLTPLES